MAQVKRPNVLVLSAVPSRLFLSLHSQGHALHCIKPSMAIVTASDASMYAPNLWHSITFSFKLHPSAVLLCLMELGNLLCKYDCLSSFYACPYLHVIHSEDTQ